MHPTTCFRTALFIASLACTLPAAAADDEQAKAIEEFRKHAQTCKASAADPAIGFELKTVPGKPASEPATPEELERVKRLLAKSSLPFDTVNHRVTYEFTLALVRAKRVAAFTVTPGDARRDETVRKCLTQLAADAGLESRFE